MSLYVSHHNTLITLGLPGCSPDKQIDLRTVDFKKLRVKDLRKILDGWDETCKGCAEKSDFVTRIKELLPKYQTSSAHLDL